MATSDKATVNGVEMTRVKIEADSKGAYPQQTTSGGLGVIGVNAGDQIYPVAGLFDVSAFNWHTFHGVAGVFTVETSIDPAGVVWSGAIFLADQMVANPDGAKVGVSADTTSMYVLKGNYNYIRVKQSGVTPANVRVRHSVV